MLKKEYRLRKNADFRKVYRSAKSVSTKYLVLYPKTRKGTGIRVGFSISKKWGKPMYVISISVDCGKSCGII